MEAGIFAGGSLIIVGVLIIKENAIKLIGVAKVFNFLREMSAAGFIESTDTATSWLPRIPIITLIPRS